MAKKHISALRMLRPDVELFALRSREPSPEIGGIQNIYRYEAIVEVDPEFILLSNPTYLRATSLKKLVPLGKPLFIEKPVLPNLDAADEVSRLMEKYGTETYVACNLRFLSCLNYLAGMATAGRLNPNEVNIYCGSYLPDWRPGRDVRKVYSSQPELGGGAHLDLIHELDYVYWIFGRPLRHRRLLRSVSTLNIPAVDYANYALSYTNYAVSVILNYYRRDYTRTMELILPETTYQVDLAANRITNEKDEVIFEEASGINDTYAKQMQHFLRELSTGRLSFNTFADGVKVLKLALTDA